MTCEIPYNLQINECTLGNSNINSPFYIPPQICYMTCRYSNITQDLPLQK